MQSEASASQLLILTGPPGAGKTTLARLLADSAERATVHLHTDNFYVAIRKGYVAPYLPAAARQNEVVMGVIAEAAWGYARGGYDVILDGIIGPWFLPPFRAVQAREPLDLSFVVLRPTLEAALARATARAGRELIDPEPIKGLYGAFAALGELEGHVVNSTGLTATETAERIVKAMEAGRFRLE